MATLRQLAPLLALLPFVSGCAMLGDYSPLAPVERRLFFYPAKYPAGDWEPTSCVYEDAYFQAADGTKLHGWYVPHENPRAHAVFFHGNGGNITLIADTLRILNRRHGLAVLVFDYRGYEKAKANRPRKEFCWTRGPRATGWLITKGLAAAMWC